MSALDDAIPMHRATNFFLARQPILDREQSLVAYELLFRSAAVGPANVTDDLAATASVIAHASELGMRNVVGTSIGFVNVDAAMLMGDLVHVLPKDQVVLEILETVHVTDALVNRVKALVRQGYHFALDDVVSRSENVERLLDLVELVKVDLVHLEDDSLSQLSRYIKSAGKKLLAEKVETIEQFEQCLALDFDYFQGYYFAHPHVLTGKRLSLSQLNIVKLMEVVASGASPLEVERHIKQDASLSLALLRLVNMPGLGTGRHIYSISQALTLLGHRHFHRWLEILLYADPGTSDASSPLLHLATTRGKLLELIAGHVFPSDRHMMDVAFTVGIFSLLDALFGMSMHDIVEQMAVADNVKEALLFRRGVLGDMLLLAECIEHVEKRCSQVPELLAKLHLSSDEFKELELAAFQWSDAVAHHAA